MNYCCAGRRIYDAFQPSFSLDCVVKHRKCMPLFPDVFLDALGANTKHSGTHGKINCLKLPNGTMVSCTEVDRQTLLLQN